MNGKNTLNNQLGSKYGDYTLDQTHNLRLVEEGRFSLQKRKQPPKNSRDGHIYIDMPISYNYKFENERLPSHARILSVDNSLQQNSETAILKRKSLEGYIGHTCITIEPPFEVFETYKEEKGLLKFFSVAFRSFMNFLKPCGCKVVIVNNL